jgi:thiamine biosynthesis protein ThiS
MNLIVNGEKTRLDHAPNVAELVAALELDSRKLAVELNLEIVPKSLYAQTPLKDGDRLEIVQFVGGG